MFNKVTGKKRFSLKIGLASSGSLWAFALQEASDLFVEEGVLLYPPLLSIKEQDGNPLCEADLVSAPALFTEHRNLF